MPQDNHASRIFVPKCLLVAEVLSKCEEEGEQGAFHQVDWSLCSSLGEMAKPGFQTNHKWCRKHVILRPPASVMEDVLDIRDI